MNEIKRLGIYTAGRLTSRMLGLMFRAQREGSTGLNAHLEILSGDNANRVAGLRICTSGDAERSARGYVCSGETETAAYWLQHSLPVVIMVYEHERGRILWEAVTTENLEIAGKRWEIVVPYENEYNEESEEIISNLTCTSPYLARLALDKSWIEMVYEGRELYLELDEWINQPSSRGNLRLCAGGADGGVYQWPFQTSPDMPQVMSLPGLFPWASLHVDEDFYREKNLHDPEPEALVPYIVESGEIARFRLRLELNVLGRAFLAAEPFICRGIFPEAMRSINYGSEYESGLKFLLYNSNRKNNS